MQINHSFFTDAKPQDQPGGKKGKEKTEIVFMTVRQIIFEINAKPQNQPGKETEHVGKKKLDVL